MKVRGFEKITSELDNVDVIIPKRCTKHAAAYDFFSPIEIVVPAKGQATIKSGIKCYFMEDEVLFFYPRSSWGIKYGIVLKNTTAVFDSDYYNNESNEGEAIITLWNLGEKDFEINKGDRFCQAVFQKFLVADGDNASGERNGGIGSTGKN